MAVLLASFISTPVSTPSSPIGKICARPYESVHTGGQLRTPPTSFLDES